jgi:hypothetical protein
VSATQPRHSAIDRAESLIRLVAPQIQPRPERRDLDGAESFYDKVRPGAVVRGEAGGERRVSGRGAASRIQIHTTVSIRSSSLRRVLPSPCFFVYSSDRLELQIPPSPCSFVRPQSILSWIPTAICVIFANPNPRPSPQSSQSRVVPR